MFQQLSYLITKNDDINNKEKANMINEISEENINKEILESLIDNVNFDQMDSSSNKSNRSKITNFIININININLNININIIIYINYYFIIIYQLHQLLGKQRINSISNLPILEVNDIQDYNSNNSSKTISENSQYQSLKNDKTNNYKINNNSQSNNNNLINIKLSNDNYIEKYNSDNHINDCYIENSYGIDDDDIIDNRSLHLNKVSYMEPNKSYLLDEKTVNEEKNNYDFNLEETYNRINNENSNNILREGLQDVSIIHKDKNNITSFNNEYYNYEKRNYTNISNFQVEKDEGDRSGQIVNDETDNNNKKNKNAFEKFKSMKSISNFVNKKSKKK
jgi:hypothetical protein